MEPSERGKSYETVIKLKVFGVFAVARPLNPEKHPKSLPRDTLKHPKPHPKLSQKLPRESLERPRDAPKASQ